MIGEGEKICICAGSTSLLLREPIPLLPLLSGVIDRRLNLVVEGMRPLVLVAVVFRVLMNDDRLVVGLGDCYEDNPN